VKIETCPNCGFRLEVRSSEQNKKLHSILHDIASQQEWAGEYRDAEVWKRLFVCAFEREKKNSPQILPAIDGHGMDIVYNRTSKMGKGEMSDLIDYCTAWALERGIALADMPPLEAA
jgi:hypothetical protein